MDALLLSFEEKYLQKEVENSKKDDMIGVIGGSAKKPGVSCYKIK
jgi:hypothetical protein